MNTKQHKHKQLLREEAETSLVTTCSDLRRSRRSLTNSTPQTPDTHAADAGTDPARHAATARRRGGGAC